MRARPSAAAAVAFCVAVLGLAPEAHAALPETWTREWRGDDAGEDFGGSLDFAGDVDPIVLAVFRTKHPLGQVGMCCRVDLP